MSDKFYPLRCEEWAEISGNLTLSELRVLYWLRTKDPYSNGININCAAIARDLSQAKSISRQTVSRAMKTLDRKDYIDLEIISANVKIRSKGVHSKGVHEHPEVQDDTDGTATHQGYDAVPSGTATHPEVQPGTTGYGAVPQGSSSYHSSAVIQAEKGFQDSKNIKNIKTLNTSLEGDKEEKSEIDPIPNTNAPDSEPINNSALAKSNGGLQKVEFSAALLNFNSANEIHWALDWFGEEPTPWLCEPKSRRNNIVFDSRFMEWHGQRWLEKFHKPDLYAAIADFRSSLLNNPEKIEGRWQEYEASIKHFAGATGTAVLHGAIIPEKDKEYILRHQKAITANTVEELDPKNAIAPSIKGKLLPQSAPTGDVGRILPAKSTGDLIVEAAIACGELERDRFSPGFWWNNGDKRCYFKSAGDWLAEIEKSEVW